ncbi:MAG: hypothetical protein K5876_04670 [Ruminiclostridium sp.]|nr:hypothetical protein [Ruminiclostridium sp.]
MVDVKPCIAGLLGDIADVELAFPERAEALPVITLSETGNVSSVILGGEDRYSVITLQIDVFADEPGQSQQLAARVNDVLAARGLKRSFAQLITDERFPRTCMRYRFGIDEITWRTVSL